MINIAEHLLGQDMARRNQKDRLHYVLVYTLHEYGEGPIAKVTDDRPAKYATVDINSTMSVRQTDTACCDGYQRLKNAAIGSTWPRETFDTV
jgi:hypothetical protein